MENQDVILLLSKLNEKTIGKGELDVVYTEYQNWSRNGLLLEDEAHLKGKQTKLSLKDYLWLRVVDKLTSFGVEYKSIKAVKRKVFSPLEPDFLLTEITKKNSKFATEYPEEFKKTREVLTVDENLKKRVLEDLKFTFTSFELLLIAMIKTGKEVQILVDESGDNEIEMDGVELSGEELERIKKLKKSAHIVIPFSTITAKYLHSLSLNSDESFFSPLTKEEHQLVRTIRGKQFIKIHSIEIHYSNQDDELIDIEYLKKKSKVEGRLLKHLQKGIYKDISYKTDDDQIISFCNTRLHQV